MPRVQRKDLKKESPQRPRNATESKENVNGRLNVPTFWEFIEDENTSNAFKVFAIKRNISAWRDKFTTKTLSPVYESIISTTIGDPLCISNLLNSRQFSRRAMPFISEFDSRNQPHDPSYSAKLIERLTRVRNMHRMNEKPNISSTIEFTSQTIDTSQIDLSVGQSSAFMSCYNEIESRYEPAKDSNETKMFGCISPVIAKRTPLKSSTPLTAKKSINKSLGSIKNSPLVRAFEKCKSMNERKRRMKTSTLTEALAVLGLTDVMDIFADPLEDLKVDADWVVAEEDINSDKTSNHKYMDIETSSTSVKNQTSQGYTVSQILRIVNTSATDPIRERLENSNSSVLDRSAGKEIYIGTIEEIFGSNDNGDIDKPTPSEKQSASEEEEVEEDVIVSSQSVICDIKLPSKYLSNSENKKTSHHPELPYNDEDMFASFAKNNSPIPSHSKSNDTTNKNDSNNQPSIIAPLPAIDPINPNFKSPSPKSSTLQTVDRSPSVFRRKINLSRLKALSMKSNSERMSTNNLQHKSPLFFSCNNLDVMYSQRNNVQQSQSIEDPSDNSSQIGE